MRIATLDQRYNVVAARRTAEKDPEIVWHQQKGCINDLVTTVALRVQSGMCIIHKGPSNFFSDSVDILRTFWKD